MSVSDEQIDDLSFKLWHAAHGRSEASFRDRDFIRSWLAPILEQHEKEVIEGMGKEPVAWMYRETDDYKLKGVVVHQPPEPAYINAWQPLYAAPPDLQAQLDAVREECAGYAASQAEYVEAGADEANPGDRLRYVEVAIRSRIGKPSPLAQLQAQLDATREEMAHAYQFGADMVTKYSRACSNVVKLRAENAELRKELEDIKDERAAMDATIGDYQHWERNLQAENAELRKDAERYRWLRDKANYGRKSDPMVCLYPLDNQKLIDGDNLDRHVDAAIAAQETSNES